MKKFSKIGKRVFALFLVALMNINTYAAVGANDGSAFITKAEFDALVNTFNEQMDDYENGLESKIDGAIANYLASLSNIRTVDLDTIINKLNANDKTFLNNSNITTYNPGSSDWDLRAGAYAIVSYADTLNTNPSGKYSKAGFVRVNSYANWGSNFSYTEKSDTKGMWKVRLKEITIDGVNYYSPDESTNKLIKPLHDLRAELSRIQGIQNSTNCSLPSTRNWTFNFSSNVPGMIITNTPGKVWTEDMWTLTHASEISNSTEEYSYLNLIPSTEYKALYNHYGVVYTRISQYDSDSQYTQSNFMSSNGGARCCGWEVNDRVTDRTGDSFNYKFYTQKEYTHSPYDWVNYSASQLWEAPVLKINGLPLFKNKLKGKITIPISITNSVGKSTVAIRTKPFTKGGIAKKTDDDIYWNDNCGGDFDITIDQNSDKNELTYWIKVMPNSPGATATFDLSGTATIETED